MSENNDCCDDYKTSRRAFLKGAAAVGAGVTTALYGDVFTTTSYAATGVADRVLVVFAMRGAADGLSLVVPHADPVYYAARPNIAIPRDKLLVGNEFWGLHPNLSPLMPMWNSGKIAAVHATGQLVTTRSHFAAMEEVEDANPGSAIRQGWINRMVGLNSVRSPIEAVQLGSGTPATQIAGPNPFAVAVNVGTLSLGGPKDSVNAPRRKKAINTLWRGVGGEIGAGARNAFEVAEVFKGVQKRSDKPSGGAKYPKGKLGEAMAGAARTIKANVGAQVITVDHGTWDHHHWIGNLESGNMKNMATEFASAVGAFWKDLGSFGDNVTLVTISEFGRRIVENSNRGLDHGHGNVMFAMGAGVKGGYYGTWPGIVAEQNADLPITTDYRDVLAEVVENCFPAAAVSKVFPGLVRNNVGFTTTL